jgi:hypothetical protein
MFNKFYLILKGKLKPYRKELKLLKPPKEYFINNLGFKHGK